jgi:hypothetical protein
MAVEPIIIIIIIIAAHTGIIRIKIKLNITRGSSVGTAPALPKNRISIFSRGKGFLSSVQRGRPAEANTASYLTRNQG